LVQRYNSDLANGYGNLVSRVVNMMHKYFGGVVPETGATTPAEDGLRESAIKTIAAFGPVFDELNFSEALKSLWLLVAETDGYLTANAPWKRPTDRSEAEHVALQARVLATAAEAIRIITALVYPILPDAAAKVWLQLGQGEIANAAKKSFLTNIAWGELRAGTKFGEPAPLFPRAEKDAVERMQNIEDQNSASAIEAATGGGANRGSAATTTSAPVTATASPSVEPSAPAKGAATQTTAAPVNAAKPVDTAKVDAVPAELASARLSSTPVAAPAARAEETQAFWDKAPVDSVGTQSADEAQAYETVAQEAKELLAIAAAHSPATPLVAAEPQLASSPTITIDDVIKVDLRVAQILVAERIPKADKLLRLEVDLGYEKRQILAGIAQYYEPEKLVGRKIVIVANLAPRKMRGLVSNGMLLAASLEGGSPVLAGFLEEVPLGARLK
jgi:methionyl-tRNA synthetase